MIIRTVFIKNYLFFSAFSSVPHIQHDIDAGMLKTAEESVVEDCVSFIGVDLNAASPHMLRSVFQNR